MSSIDIENELSTLYYGLLSVKDICTASAAFMEATKYVSNMQPENSEVMALIEMVRTLKKNVDILEIAVHQIEMKKNDRKTN